MSEDLAWIGVDLGTQSVRALAVADDGSPLAAASRPLTSHRDGPRHEQDPEQWWSAIAGGSTHIGVMPMTTDRVAAMAWLADQPRGIEGCVAKRRDQTYRPRVRGWLGADKVQDPHPLNSRSRRRRSVRITRTT